jgi:hypothetical protein
VIVSPTFIPLTVPVPNVNANVVLAVLFPKKVTGLPTGYKLPL